MKHYCPPCCPLVCFPSDLVRSKHSFVVMETLWEHCVSVTHFAISYEKAGAVYVVLEASSFAGFTSQNNLEVTFNGCLKTTA